ncbi:hypothetical protein phiM1EF2_089 [Enterococcus phage phiM1EF2]|nr:hypothetical protein phiM1EF2_089 [Enterococcus phage phiM1EF2]
MLLFNDKNELKRRIKALEEGLSDANLLKKRYKERLEELNKHITAMDYQHEADEERWTEQLESYEEKLIQRDLKISSMELLHEQLEEQIESLEEELEKASEGSVAMLSDLRLAESAYESLNELLQKVTESLWESGERLWELEEENSRLREELHDAMMEIERLKKESKSPYQTAVINVDVRDTLTKQLAKSLKQVNEAFEKRYKKKYVFTQNGASDHYECSTLDELLNELRITCWIKEADINNIREEYESLEEIFNKEGKAYTTLSFFSIEYNSRINITATIIKEEI